MKIRNWLFRKLFCAEYLRMRELESATPSVKSGRLGEPSGYDTQAAMHQAQQLNMLNNTLFPQAVAKSPRARFDRYVAMTDEGLIDALAGTAHLPCMKAVMQLVDDKFQQASDAASDPALPDGQTKFHLGGADWIVKLKADLQSYSERTKEG